MKRLSLLLAAAACTQAPPAELPSPVPVAAAAVTSPPAAADRALPATWPLTVPDESTIPEGELGDAIRRGKTLVTHTREELPDYVTSSGLHCSSCHLQAGTVAKAGPWVGITGMFPMYRSRSASVITIEERVNDCMTRSMNGKPLPADSDEMTAIVAYMTWLSQGVPVGVPIEGRGFAKSKDAPTPDPAHGQELFAQKCSACHGAEGQGLDTPDGGYVYPALWGDRSFNIGAGMARLDTAAAFVRWNMPLGQGGTLTDQEAYDLAAFFTTQPRPDLAGKENDWPRGGKPRDARY